EDVVRVRVVWDDAGPYEPTTDRRPPVYYWLLKHLICSTAGHYWASHSWRSFFHHAGSPHFLWRTSSGQRLVLDLGRGVAFTDEKQLSEGLAAAVAEAERREVVSLLDGLSRRMDEVRA